MAEMRLQKFLARAGVASRRHAEELIAAGRVTVNGARVTEMGVKVDPAADVVAVDGAILGKPASEEEACAMIRRIAGRTHQVFTGVAIVRGQREKTFAVESRVTVYPMSEEEIRGYVAAGESMDKAGAYGIQGRFAAFIRELSGSYTNVMGLPVGRLYQELKAFSEENDD